MTGAKPAPCAQGPQSGGELHRTMMPWSETWIRNPETSSYKPNQKQGFNVGAAARHRPGSGSRHILSRELRSGATTRSKHSETQKILHTCEEFYICTTCTIRDLGQDRSLFPLSPWPVTTSLKDALLASVRQCLTVLISQDCVPSSPQPEVFPVWGEFCGNCYGTPSRAVRGLEKCCFL